ncbi:uncharacterized protein LOC130939627 isoform X2 [Arachis stenosperma]|uniref:uncharacterized protein LOC130939627 isoform X2 n=1 Tax=Arachis stenosperma TaxID=217475 RepID=UPI0025AD91F1|nr:uncharacterized protein LOC130939627 isoform X2 [Arachis stenosperma]
MLNNRPQGHCDVISIHLSPIITTSSFSPTVLLCCRRCSALSSQLHNYYASVRGRFAPAETFIVQVVVIFFARCRFAAIVVRCRLNRNNQCVASSLVRCCFVTVKPVIAKTRVCFITRLPSNAYPSTPQTKIPHLSTALLMEHIFGEEGMNASFIDEVSSYACVLYSNGGTQIHFRRSVVARRRKCRRH